jgi:hypothetical protein
MTTIISLQVSGISRRDVVWGDMNITTSNGGLHIWEAFLCLVRAPKDSDGWGSVIVMRRSAVSLLANTVVGNLYYNMCIVTIIIELERSDVRYRNNIIFQYT